VILDTDGLSALAEGEPDVEFFLFKAKQVSIPAVVLGEYRYGSSLSQPLLRKMAVRVPQDRAE
jgi:predicted nucleic acid-binding protein